jgi:multicomponent K+:H+ antiporter subunit A
MLLAAIVMAAVPAASGLLAAAPGRAADAAAGLVGLAGAGGGDRGHRGPAPPRLLALVVIGAVGLAVSLVFVFLSAPDLALTQLLVEWSRSR